MKESDIISKIRGYLKTVENLFSWKEHGGQFGQAGIPDIICCYKGKFVAFEVKAGNGRTTVLQEIMLRKIREVGGTAQVVRSVGEVKEIIEKIC